MKSSKTYAVILSLLLLASSYGNNIFCQGKRDASFVFITYNIRLNTPSDGINAWPERKDKVIGLIRFHEADIFVVQEALPEQMDDLIRGFPEFDFVGVGRDDGKREGEHVAIFFRKSRFTKLNYGTFWLNEKPDGPGLGWDAACNRTCTWVKLNDKLGGKNFYVFGTHLDHRGIKAREEGTKLILSKLHEINTDNNALILAGDFNLTKESQPINAIMKILFDSRDKSLTPHYGPEGTSGGFDVKPKSRTIDFVFVNSKLTVYRHGHLSDSFGTFYPSDHLPVLVELSIN